MRGNRFIQLRIDEQQRDVWGEAADFAGIDLSRYIRGAVCARIVAENPDLYECATCGVLVSNESTHEHAASWQGT